MNCLRTTHVLNVLAAAVTVLFLLAGGLEAAVELDTTADFSGTQGTGGLSYGYFTTPGDPSTFTIAGMAFNAGANPSWQGPIAPVTGGNFPTVFRNDNLFPGGQFTGGHPVVDGTTFASSVLRYQSEVAASVGASISGDYQDLFTFSGDDGATVRVWHDPDGAGITNPQSLFTAPATTNLQGYGILGVTLNPASVIYFEMDPNANSTSDFTRLTGVITVVPEPASGMLLGLGLAVLSLGAVFRRRFGRGMCN